MSELIPCPFCGSTAVVKCRVDSDWGVDLKYRLLNDESNYDIKSMIADENYDSDEQSGDYWGIEIFRCQSCRAEWGGGTDVCVAALTARIAELESAQRWRVAADGELPDDRATVLVAFKNREILTATYYKRYEGFGGVENYWHIEGWHTGNVTHWMPRPQPPEVQE